MMIIFLHYIRNQEKETLLKRFLEAQLTNPTKGDWITHIRYILKILNVDKTIEEIKCMKIKHFMEIVIRKTKIMLLGKTISKGTEIDFGTDLKCHKYLLHNKTFT